MKFIRGLFFLLTLFILAACSNNKAPATDTAEHTPFTTVVLSDFAGQNLEKVDQEGTLIFTKATIMPQGGLGELQIHNPEEVKPGDIITSVPTEAAPYGLLKKVISVKVDEETDKVYIETEEATLEEAFTGAKVEPGDYVLRAEKMDFYKSSVLYDPETIVINEGETWQPPKILPNPTLDPQAYWSFGKNYNFDKDVWVNGVKVNLKGSVELSAFAQLELSLKWRWFRIYVDHFLAKAGGGIKGNATVTAKGNMNFHRRFVIAAFNLRTDFFWVGPVPVVLSTVYTITSDIRGNLSVDVSLATSAHFNAEFGAEYRDGRGWRDIKNASHGISATPSTTHWRADANAKVALDNEISVYLYGMAGPAVGISPYVRANTHCCAYNQQQQQWSTWWGQGYVGIDGTIAMDARRIRRNLYWQKRFNFAEWRVW